MNNKKRTFIKSILLGASGIGVYRSIPIAYACSGTSYEKIEYPASALTNLTKGPMARYIDSYYPQGERHYGYMISIETNKITENFNTVPIKVSLTSRDYWEGTKGLTCTQIDVLSQQFNSFTSGEYIDAKNRRWTDTTGQKEGVIHKVASYQIDSDTLPVVAFRYRRIFKNSRIIVVATLIDNVTKEKRDLLISYTGVLRGGSSCIEEVVITW